MLLQIDILPAGTIINKAENMGEKVRDLKAGEKALVLGFSDVNPFYRNRLLSMGVLKNTEITLLKMAPLGDPVEIEVKGYSLSLRKEEADILDIKRI